MIGFEFLRVLEEIFADDGEEFGLVGGSVGIDVGSSLHYSADVLMYELMEKMFRVK